MTAIKEPRIQTINRPKLEEFIPLMTPFIINVDPSDACNFQCKFCPTADRQLMKNVGRAMKPMSFELFKKIVDDISEFENPIKVLRLYKDGEPLVNPKFADMVRYAKNKACAEVIDTTTNASLLNPEKNLEIIDAGLDRINISIYGVNASQYLEFSKYRLDYDKLVANIRHFYEHRQQCHVLVKINGDIINPEDVQLFYELFGDIADSIFDEHSMSCWPEFNLDEHGVKANDKIGIYGQPIKEVMTCPYIFYSFSINSDGLASACFLDWSRKLIIGDACTQSINDIWMGTQMKQHQLMMLRQERKSHPVCGACNQLTHGMPDDIDAFSAELLKKFSQKV